MTRGAHACVALILTANLAFAQVTPLVFEREDIRITSPAKADIKAADKQSVSTASPHAPLTFNIEVRSQDALRLEYIHTLNSLSDKTGVMLTLATPAIVGLPPYKVPTAVGWPCFVLENGVVEQILPNVVLAEMTQEIVARPPIKAFLFLKAGTVKALGIRPLDVITASAFTPAPPLMQ